MAITVEDGLSILIDTVKNNKEHKHYKRVTELADLYKKLITGHKIDKLLEQFVRREDHVMFEQRKLMTQAITPAVSASIMTPFYKVPRANSIIEKIDFNQTENIDDKKKNLNEALDQYNGDRSLKRYMENRFVDISFTDPNSFIVTEFDTPPLGPQGEMTQRVLPRPFEVSSYEAINFKYDNNILKWLIVRQIIKQISVTECYYSYTIYLDNDSIKFTQVSNEESNIADGQMLTSTYVTKSGETKDVTYYRISEKLLFIVERFNYKSNKVPAKRIGYKRDLVTDGETYVNPLHDALPYFMKSIKTVSEFDLTMALHAFPQKFQYSPRCQGESASITCDGGKNPEGHICNSCKGSGLMPIHTTTQDAVVMRMPKRGEEIIDLQQLIHYEYPNVEIIKFQNEFISQLKEEAKQAVFNSEGLQRTSVTKTATELDYSYEAVYDALFPFAEAYSDMYKHQVYIIAVFRDITDIIVEHRFPKDFKFKTVSDLLGELKQANDSNAPGYIRQEISSDIAEQQFVDKPEELKKIKIKQKFFPFPDKTPTEIIYVISNGLTTEYNKILWSNFDNIFSELEAGAEKEGKYFYDNSYELQKTALDEKVQEYMEEIKPETATGFGESTEDVITDNLGGGE